jgi:hypothetical protein
MITRYINKISTINATNYITGDTTTEYSFYGDGNGDFEDIENDATEETLKDYIEFCREQIKIAKEYLKIKEESYLY